MKQTELPQFYILCVRPIESKINKLNFLFRLRQRVPPHSVGQTSYHSLRADRHPLDAAIFINDRGRPGTLLPPALRQNVRHERPDGEAGRRRMPVRRRQGQGPHQPLLNHRPRLHLLRSRALPQAREMEHA